LSRRPRQCWSGGALLCSRLLLCRQEQRHGDGVQRSGDRNVCLRARQKREIQLRTEFARCGFTRRERCVVFQPLQRPARLSLTATTWWIHRPPDSATSFNSKGSRPERGSYTWRQIG